VASNTASSPQTSGLALWRQRQAEERRLRLMELEHYRAYATTEIREGREFQVVRIPDRYTFKPMQGGKICPR
jgi:hypothetical protein